MKFQITENLILETDCPYLIQEPKRGIENEPANLSIIGKYISDFTGTDIHKISEWSFQIHAIFIILNNHRFFEI